MRLLALTGVVLVALVGASTAQALTEPQSTLLRQIDATDLKAFIHSPDFVGNPALNTNPQVQTGVSRMQIASGRLATLGTIGKISAVATGSVVVWQVADALGLGGYVYKKITGSAYGGTTTGFSPGWKYYSGGVSPANFPAIPSLSWVFHHTYDTSNPPAGYNPSTGWFDSNWATMAGTITGSTTIANTGSYDCGGVGECFIKYRTPTQMMAAVTIEPSSAAEYGSPPSGALTVSGGTNDTSTLTDPELEAALDEIDPDPGTAGTATEQATAEAILDELAPGWDIGVLLQPLPNETYTDYITRLQEAGYVGTATTTVLTTVEPGYGPEAVVRVIATPVGGTSTVYDPLNWPSPAPEIATDSAITIRYNPNTAPEAPTTATPTTIAVPPTTIPSAPALDFTPITDIDFGCKFPYGFLCYAVDFTEQFDVAADAPVFTFDMEMDVALGSFDLGTYEVDLEVMDAWMALWRDILSVVLVVGAIYFVATRMLGFKAGGDPGAAMDDVL